jgi:cobalt-zinc-cadmium efflux system outer membrane protein
MCLSFLFYCLRSKGFLFTRCLGILLICSATSINSPGQAASGVQSENVSNAMTADDLIRHALAANAELAAARLDIERRRARLWQAGLRPNPTLDFEQQSGVFNSPGERATTIGISLPLELGGKRQRRIDLARAELEATEAEVADRERRLANAVFAAHAEALAALHELSITEELNTVDIEGVRVVEARVNEGDAAPLELNLLRVEVDRLRSRRSLIEGRLRAAMLKLQSLAGVPLDRPLRLRESLPAVAPIEPPGSLESAIETALRTRPDLKLARLEEDVAQAGLRLARAQAAPDLSLFTRYGTNRNTIDTTPIGPLTDLDRQLSFGVSITLPVFNRNQGAKAEAATAIAQAQRRREFIEQVVRAEVMGAYARYQAARNALTTFEQGVIARSNENIRVIRGAYQIGGFRITELLNEQRRLLDAQREYTEALAERYRAWADLQAAIGAIN